MTSRFFSQPNLSVSNSNATTELSFQVKESVFLFVISEEINRPTKTLLEGNNGFSSKKSQRCNGETHD